MKIQSVRPVTVGSRSDGHRLTDGCFPFVPTRNPTAMQQRRNQMQADHDQYLSYYKTVYLFENKKI
jgi:hypothetical protein